MPGKQDFRIIHRFDGEWWGKNEESQPWMLIDKPSSGAAPASRHGSALVQQGGFIEPEESQIMQAGFSIAGQAMSRPVPAMPEGTGDAEGMAHAGRIAATPRVWVFAAALGGAAILLTVANPSNWLLYWIGALLLWGWASLRTLERNDRFRLHHSATGVQHAQIEANKEVALEALNRTFDHLGERLREGR